MGCSSSREVPEDEGAAFPEARVAVTSTLNVDSALKQGRSRFVPPPAVTLKILVIGSSGVGKTSLVHRYVHQKFSLHYRATLGADFGTKRITCSWTRPDELAENQSPEVSVVTLQLWDTAGQERYRSLGTAFYRGADAVALVYDVTNRKSFDELEEWVHDFLDKSGLHDKKLPHPLPFFLVANKVDCDESMVEVSPHEARDLVDRLTKDEALQVVSGMELIETSAQLNTGVAELFEGSAVKCLKNAASESAYSDRDVFVVPDVRSSRNNG